MERREGRHDLLVEALEAHAVVSASVAPQICDQDVGVEDGYGHSRRSSSK